MTAPATLAPTRAAASARELPAAWWLAAPIALYALRLAVHFGFGEESTVEAAVRSEWGVVENLTAIVLLATVALTAVTLARFGAAVPAAARIFLVLYLLGGVYFLGEEVSWGQHLAGWSTPEAWRSLNDQQETNVHNTLALFDRLPKTALSGLIFLGGVALPLWERGRGAPLAGRRRLWWLLPTWVCFPTALIVTLCSLPEKVEHYTGLDFYYHQAQETKELFIAYFLLLFVASLYARLEQAGDRRWGRPQADPVGAVTDTAAGRSRGMLGRS